MADRLTRLIADPRNPAFVTHSVADILRARMLAIAFGYEDADDLDQSRTYPGFKLTCGRLPDSGRDLCSQPSVSRWENAPTLREVVRTSYAMADAYFASYARPPRGNGVVRGQHRRLHLRPAGQRRAEPATRQPAADDVRTRRAEAQAPALRRYAELRYCAESWDCERRVAARIESTTLGLNIRCVVTNLGAGTPEWLYGTLHCARGQAENLIKLHKGQLASDRTS